jgi:hypothetical protein
MARHPMAEPLAAETVPAELLDAFTAYERAIMANDLDALDAAFAPGDGTMRGDAAGLLVGHDAISAFREDRAALEALAEDQSIDLFAKIPHGDGQTYIREILLVADHNAYHLGQLVAVRQQLGAWGTA